jgi:hypothetical protein
MQSATSFAKILALRGRIIIFTPSAPIGLRFEQMAEREHAQVVCTRGWADAMAPLSMWQRIHESREFGLLSCDQRRYVTGVRMHATDLVWVGETGDPLNVPHLWGAFSQAMGRAHIEDGARMWLVSEDAA